MRKLLCKLAEPDAFEFRKTLVLLVLKVLLDANKHQ